MGGVVFGAGLHLPQASEEVSVVLGDAGILGDHLSQLHRHHTSQASMVRLKFGRRGPSTSGAEEISDHLCLFKCCGVGLGVGVLDCCEQDSRLRSGRGLRAESRFGVGVHLDVGWELKVDSPDLLADVVIDPGVALQRP